MIGVFTNQAADAAVPTEEWCNDVLITAVEGGLDYWGSCRNYDPGACVVELREQEAEEVMRRVRGEVQSINHLGLNRAGRRVDIGAGNHVNALQVVSCRHADTHVVVAAGGNYASLIGSPYMGNRGHHTKEQQLDLLREVLDGMGYQIRRKPQRRK